MVGGGPRVDPRHVLVGLGILQSLPRKSGRDRWQEVVWTTTAKPSKYTKKKISN